MRASHGAFKLTFGASTTPDLPFDASGEEVRAALDGLSSIGEAGGSVDVDGRVGSLDGSTPYIYVITFKGSLAADDVPQLGVAGGAEALGGGSPVTELEVRTLAQGTSGGSGLESCTSESGCQGGAEGSQGGQINFVQSLTVGPGGDIYVGEIGRIQQFSPAGAFVRAWGGDVIRDGASGAGVVSPGSASITSVATNEKAFMVGQPIEGTGIEADTTITGVAEHQITLSKPAGSAATGTTTNLTVPPGPNNVSVNQTQTVTIGPNVTGGTFTLTFEVPNPSLTRESTGAIPVTATAVEVEEKLVALSNINPGDVAVTGSPGGPWTVEFKGARYGGSDSQSMSANPGGLTGVQEVTVASANGEETCEVAGECQSGVHGTLYNVAFAPGGGTLYAGYGRRVREFSPNGADLGDLPDPDKVRGASPLTASGIASLAVSPTSGDVYIDFPVFNGGSSGVVYQLDPGSGKLVRAYVLNTTTFDQGGAGSGARPGSLGVDGAGDLYVVDGRRGEDIFAHLIVFDAAGNRLAPPLSEEEKCEEQTINFVDFCEEALGIQAGRAPGSSVNEFSGLGVGPAGDLYVSVVHTLSTATAEFYVQAYGPPPLGLESPPSAPPVVEDQYAVSADTTGAELRAKVNPHFFSGALGATRYYVQYGTARCVEPSPGATDWSAACVADSSVPPGSKLHSGVVNEGVNVTAFLSGLTPATEYRYRFVAESTGAPGHPVYGLDPDGEGPGLASVEEGLGASFATASVPGMGPACSQDEVFRTGPSAALPDCRAYERLSAPERRRRHRPGAGQHRSRRRSHGRERALRRQARLRHL